MRSMALQAYFMAWAASCRKLRLTSLVLAGRNCQEAFKVTRQMTLVGKPAAERGFGDRDSRGQQMFGPEYTDVIEIRVGCQTEFDVKYP
jgi:hypothetical protein